MDIASALGAWSVGNGSLRRCLSDALRQAIERGSLRPGARLPSERALARRLAVSRSTVVAAYDTLRAEGLVESRQGSGTRVTGSGPATELAAEAGERRPVGSLYRALLEDKREVLSLAYAIQPAHELVAAAAAEVVAERGAELFSHTGYAPRGLPELRAALADLHTREGLPTTTEQILVTTGAQQAINLAAIEFLGNGDPLVVESPTFAGTLDNFRARGARLAPVPMDAEGVDADGVSDAVERLRPAAIYLMPSFHNPTGVALSEPRRRRLAEVCSGAGVPLIEDNALEHNRLDLAPPPPIATFAPDAPVLTVGSFSKLAWGGLRLGWMRGPERLVDRLAQRKVLTDLGTPLLDQAVGVRLLGHVDRLRSDRQTELRANLALITRLLHTRLPEWEWDVPQGGPSLWVHLPVGSASSFAQVALRHGVEVVDGDAMSPTGGHSQHLRFPFTGPAAVLEVVVDRLTDAWDAYKRSRATADETAGVVV